VDDASSVLDWETPMSAFVLCAVKLEDAPCLFQFKSVVARRKSADWCVCLRFNLNLDVAHDRHDHRPAAPVCARRRLFLKPGSRCYV
jgi:hypothetical protein